jgi:hypothetical protein
MSEAFSEFLSTLSVEMQESLKSSTPRILERCHFQANELDSSENTQIIVGEVQSGKTSSFTALAALARDSSTPIVIIIAGTKKNLVKQTHDRLVSDLKIGTNAGMPSWEIVDKPTAKKSSAYFSLLNQWEDSKKPLEFKTTLVLMVLKSPAGLRNCAEFMENIAEHINLTQHPILIIDDEADQAGLNIAVKRGSQSTVYRNILMLRNSIPWHAYCMYTATPQANFLIDIIDELSPSRVTLLDAGSSYMGGDKLFAEDNNFIVPIPNSELALATDPNYGDFPPESLKKSIAFFLISLLVSQKRGQPKPLSMLIHPSGKQIHHNIYASWTKEIVKSWELQLKDETDSSFKEVIENVIEPAIKELVLTLPENQLPFDGNLIEIAKYLTFLIPLVEIRLVNGASDKHNITKEEWNHFPGWIVIGGNKLDRGFTIENLAVTYMPRNASANADTLQQRGRFFGYKSNYSEILRGWFSNESEEMFTDYVIHEKIMRSHLREIDENNTDVRKWRRQFVLPTNLNPTRDQVVSLITNQWRLGQGFIFTQRRLYDSSVAIGYQESFSKIEKFLNKSKYVESDTRTDLRNKYINIPVEEVLELLDEWIAHPDDRKQLTELVRIIKKFAEIRKIDAHLFFMDGLNLRERGPSEYDNTQTSTERDWKVGNLFAGKQHRGSMYLGDTAMKSSTGLTVQFHKIHPRRAKSNHQTLAIAIAGGSDLDFKVVEESTS